MFDNSLNAPFLSKYRPIIAVNIVNIIVPMLPRIDPISTKRNISIAGRSIISRKKLLDFITLL